MRMKQDGFSLMEVIMAIGVGTMLVVAVTSFLNQLGTSQRQLDLQIKANEYFATLTAILSNPDQCAKAIGGGEDPLLDYPGTIFDINTGIASLAIRDPAMPLDNSDPKAPNKPNVKFSAHAGPILEAPETAKAHRQLVIRELALRNVTALGTEKDAEYMRPNKSILTVARRSFAVDLVTSVESTAQGAIPLRPKSIPVVIEVDRLKSGGPQVWRIRSCRGGHGEDSQLGWDEDDVTEHCEVIGAKVNESVRCPVGTYMMSTKLVIQAGGNRRFECGCGSKGGCVTCEERTTTADPKITCCPAVR